MIYEIISKNDVPTSQMHIYLKNKTGDDGGIYPEIFNDLALTESVNGLYAFAIACILTDNFTNTTNFLKGYPSKEVASLALIQYIKGIATTVQLNSQCVNSKYDNLVAINQLGTSPTLLNLDGDLFYKHYDTTKYFSKEAADEAEDSFPYWVIKIVKEIKECTELVVPTTRTFELPYYIQNIGNNYIFITDKMGTFTEKNIIGKIPPSGIEALVDIIDDVYGVLASSENAYVYLTDELRPIKHVVDLAELNSDNGTLKLPNTEFDVQCKQNVFMVAGKGINTNYYDIDGYSYNAGDKIHIKRLFRNTGVIDDGIYIQLHSDYVSIVPNAPTEHTKNDKYEGTIANGEPSTTQPIHGMDKYFVIIRMASIDAAKPVISNIIKKSDYKNAYIDIDSSNNVSIVVYSGNDQTDVGKVKKKILSMGYKATIVETSEFFKK